MIEERVEIPDLKEGQVLVKVYFSGVCRSQLMEARGERGEDPYLPHMLGHEGSATIVEAGPGVTRFKKGDLVILTWIKSLGADVPQTKYQKDKDKKDSVTPPRVAKEFDSLLPNSTLVWINNCGHAPMMEHPAEFNTIVFEWLQKKRF